jgi:hypothetical protein
VASSSIPALKRKLKARLEARTALSGVQISYGAPLPNPGREYIWLGDADGNQSAATMNPVTKPRNEEYTLQVRIWAQVEGTNQQTATERAFTLAAEIENELRDDITVNGAVRGAQFGEGEFRLEEMASDTARAALLTVSVFCEARI